MITGSSTLDEDGVDTGTGSKEEEDGEGDSSGVPYLTRCVPVVDDLVVEDTMGSELVDESGGGAAKNAIWRRGGEEEGRG